MSVQMVDVFQFLDIIHLNCIWNAEVRSRMGWLAGGLGKTTVGGEGGGGIAVVQVHIQISNVVGWYAIDQTMSTLFQIGSLKCRNLGGAW